MKRTPLMRSSKPMKRTPLRPISKKAWANYSRYRSWIVDVYKKWWTKAGFWICFSCHTTLNKSHVVLDHIVPRSAAPELKDNPFNFQPICKTCNVAKNDTTRDYRPREFIKYQKHRISRDWEYIGDKWYLKDERDRV